VPLLADDHGDGRRADQPIGLHVPPGAAQHGVAGRGQGGEVGDGGPGDEAAACARWQPEEVDEPAQGDLLQFGRGRGDVVEGAVLIPRPGQPVGGQRHGQRAADDEAEEAPPGNGEGSRGAGLVQLG